MGRASVALTILMLLGLSLYAFETAGGTQSTSTFNDDWLKTVVSIELLRGHREPMAIGTGFLVRSLGGNCLLFTAAHVVRDHSGKTPDGLAFRLNRPKAWGRSSFLIRDRRQREQGMGQWFFCAQDDLACRFIALGASADILAIPRTSVLPSSQLQAGASCVILGFPMGLRSTEYATPIVRSAMVSRADSTLVIIDGFAFPGNSGGPVVYVPPHKHDGNRPSSLVGEQHVIGVVKCEISSVDRAISEQSGTPRVIFKDNMGLTEVIPADRILALITHDDVIQLDRRIQEKRAGADSQLSD